MARPSSHWIIRGCTLRTVRGVRASTPRIGFRKDNLVHRQGRDVVVPHIGARHLGIPHSGRPARTSGVCLREHLLIDSAEEAHCDHAGLQINCRNMRSSITPHARRTKLNHVVLHVASPVWPDGTAQRTDSVLFNQWQMRPPCLSLQTVKHLCTVTWEA